MVKRRGIDGKFCGFESIQPGYNEQNYEEEANSQGRNAFNQSRDTIRIELPRNLVSPLTLILMMAVIFILYPLAPGMINSDAVRNMKTAVQSAYCPMIGQGNQNGNNSPNV